MTDVTRDNYAGLLRRRVSVVIGRRRVTDLRADDIEKMLLHIQELGRSGRYLSLVLNLARRVLDYGVRRDVVLRNVADCGAGPRIDSLHRA